MASTSTSTSSRQAALERRKALTDGGKKSAGRYASTPGRVRTVSDARPTRTVASAPSATPVSSAPAPVPQPSPRAPQLTRTPSTRQPSPPSRIANPSRDLVLARRQALSIRGKRADTSKDRTRTEPARPTATGAGAPQVSPATSSVTPTPVAQTAAPALSLSSSRATASRGGSAVDRRSTPKRSANHNPSRALVLARREALSKRGKASSTPTSTIAASVARQTNPDISSRELAQKVRELKCKVGSAGTSRNGGTRPSGPDRRGAQKAAAADASWKVGVSETLGGQIVTGTQANRSLKTTGNEAATCRAITGTEYLGSEVFQTFCQSEAPSRQPEKVRITATSHGNRVTGNEVGRSEKVTGDEPGTCKLVTGTEYVSANQAAAYCGTSASTGSPRKVGHALTNAGRPVSGVMVGRSERVTGNEAGATRQLTGDQYINVQAELPGRVPAKVANLQTLRGTGVTGTHVGRSEHVTGDEPGSCRIITGDEYIGAQQYDRFCGALPSPEPAKVGFSVTNRQQVVSGTRTGRSEKVTGDEPGTCKAVTGTPYAGLDEAGTWCSTQQVDSIRRRTPLRMGSVMTGIQPGIGGVMTGAGKGACEDVTGTPYVGPDQMAASCGIATAADSDFPQPLDQSPWQQFSVQSPSRVAQTQRERTGVVTGSSYTQGGKITGPFDMASGKVTGTEQFRHERRSSAQAPLAPSRPVAAAPEADPSGRQLSRVTGEGSGQRITGDDWDRGERVTGTEGVSARRRNPSRAGARTAMPSAMQFKRNDEVPQPVSRVTGSSGNTASGSLITVSGGARG
jgi:hypothetical protein